MYFVELGIFILAIIVFFALAIDNLRVRLRASRLNAEVNQSVADYIALSKKMEESLKNSDEKKIEQTEGFLKFVSESRDWAFQYIERVQIAIKNFQDIFHPIADQYYKDKKVYGLPTAIGQEEFGKLFEAYRKLIEELPDEGKKK
jgi:hypothetical protein